VGIVSAEDEILVSNFSNAVTVYNRTANGNVAPIRSFSGGLSNPQGIAVDVAHSEVFIANFSLPSSISVYPLGASGSVSPIRSITGDATGLLGTYGLTLDTVHDEIVVTNSSSNSVAVFSRTANGNVAPTRTISGGSTGLAFPGQVVVDTAHDELAVANALGASSSITVFARTANGDVAPVRTIIGASTGLSNPQGLTLDTVHDEYAAMNLTGGGSITVYSRTANGNVAPLRTIAGASAGFSNPRGLTLDLTHDEFIVANSLATTNTVAVFSRTADGDVAPLRTIAGSATGLFGPNFTAIAPAPTPIPRNYHTVTPCRAVDTRGANAPALSGGTDRAFAIAGACGVPSAATAVSLNVTVTAPNAAGDLRLYPTTLPLVSTINFRSGQTRANNAVAALSPTGEIHVRCDMAAGKSVHFIVDVSGYFE
jgi:6-phosphogluconolactonase (cycloisomerase 2 family)